MLALGFDFGTSGARAVVIDASKTNLTTVRTNYDLSDPRSWADALFTLLQMLPAQLRCHIGAIAISGTSGTVLLTDSEGTPLTRPLLYHQSQGVDLHFVPKSSPACAPSSSLAKLLFWQERLEPSLFKRAYFLHQADWLGWLLHGQLGVTDYHNALKLGFDVVPLAYPQWFPPLKCHLPQVLCPGAVVAPLLPAIAHKYHLSPDCVVCAGTTDSNASVLASLGERSWQEGIGMTMLGSTLAVKVITAVPIFASQYGIYSHRWDWQGRTWYVAGGASNTGGAVLAHFFSPEQLAQLSSYIDPHTPSPYDYYPLLQAGERFPIADPNYPPRLDPHPNDPVLFLHGLLEGIARIEKQGYALLASLGSIYPNLVITTGGGAKNNAWQLIRERVLGRPCIPAKETEAAYGSALLAQFGHTFEPTLAPKEAQQSPCQK